MMLKWITSLNKTDAYSGPIENHEPMVLMQVVKGCYP